MRYNGIGCFSEPGNGFFRIDQHCQGHDELVLKLDPNRYYDMQCITRLFQIYIFHITRLLFLATSLKYVSEIKMIR